MKADKIKIGSGFDINEIEKTFVGIPLKFNAPASQFFNFAGNDVINLIVQNRILITGIGCNMQVLRNDNTPISTFDFSLAVDVVSPSIFQPFGITTGAGYPVNSETFYFNTNRQFLDVSFLVNRGQQFQINPTLGSVSAVTGATDQISIQTYLKYKQVF